MKKSKIIITALVALVFSCKGNADENNQLELNNIKELSIKSELVNIESEDACINFLKSKTFKDEKLTLSFLSDGYAEVRDATDNSTFIYGTFSLGEKYGTASRRLSIIDLSGSGKVKLLLSSDGKIMDESSFSIYK